MGIITPNTYTEARGLSMATLYLNDWSMVGTGSLSSQWSKVNRWLELQSYLSDTYGITEISAPHDLKNRLFSFCISFYNR